MRTSRKFTHALLALFALVVMSSFAMAADPGLLYPATSEVSDQKAGSLLVYNIYTSGATSGVTQNARINITNTSTSSGAFVHLYFVAEGCSIADAFICLTASQTTSFLASDVDPGVKGYIVAVAVDGVNGCPAAFNWLIGDEYVKFSTGHAANLGAEAFSALWDGPGSTPGGAPVLPGCDANSTIATLNFTGAFGGYNLVPAVLAGDNVPSRADNNDTMVIVNRIGQPGHRRFDAGHPVRHLLRRRRKQPELLVQRSVPIYEQLLECIPAFDAALRDIHPGRPLRLVQDFQPDGYGWHPGRANQPVHQHDTNSWCIQWWSQLAQTETDHGKLHCSSLPGKLLMA